MWTSTSIGVEELVPTVTKARSSSADKSASSAGSGFCGLLGRVGFLDFCGFYADRQTGAESLSQQSKTRTSVADPGSASGGTFQCMQFLPFLSIFSYLFYLGYLSLLGLQTKTRRQSNSSTLCSFKSHNPETFMSSTASASVHAICKRSQKCLVQKVGHLGSLGWIPMIQVLLNSSCVALQYMRLEQSFFIETFQSYTLLKIVQKLLFHRVCLHTNQ